MPAAESLDSSFNMNGQESFQQMEVFPLLLQAQDLVSKLENRVVELETDLETINDSHEQERDQLLQEIGEKDEYIHSLKTKIKGQFLDSIKLCLNYLKSAQNNNHKPKNYRKQSRRDSKIQHDEPDHDRINDHNETKHFEKEEVQISNHNEDISRQDDQEKNDHNNKISRRESVCSDQVSVDLGDYGIDGNEDIAAFDDDTFQTSPRQSIDYDLDDEEELEHRRRAEFGTTLNGPVPDISHTENLCPNCNTLLAQVDQHIEERAYLKRDLSALAISLSEEQTIRAQIQANKENLEQEIDEWVNAMFEKVNQMVYDEANVHRLRELKLLLVHLDTTKQRQTAPNCVNALNRNSVRRSFMSNSPLNSPRSSKVFGFGHMSPSIFSTASVDEYIHKGRRVYIDGVVFEEFQEYVKSFITSSAPTNSTPTHAFMKRCMIEDIQPCLFEGSSGWKSPFYKRRLLDAIMKNQCEIQTIYYSSSNSVPSTPLSSQISSTSNTRQNSYQESPPSPKVKCSLCGHVRSCDFRMRLSGPDAAVPPSATTISSSQTSRFSVTGTPGWIPLDRFCRDRVVAVCDFYTYLSHLRQGLLAHSAVWTMCKQCLKHRRKMSMARVGSVSMFEEEEALNNELLNNPEMEGMVVIVH
ncbi:983_t:CDS:2 [Funneliformis geosporum]|uniref:983_t:CDS:1 n=1 Tax=Funneliformis geosporum TaxID=1117311 RepID=A0A9W4SK29_9GLOM|nr:983_t:CDS:2 [Funneliformis geosporum]